MSAHVIYDPAQNVSVLACNTSDRTFGPVFRGQDAADFLEWMEERGRDPRSMNENTLDVWVKTWENELAGPTDVEIYGAGVK